VRAWELLACVCSTFIPSDVVYTAVTAYLSSRDVSFDVDILIVVNVFKCISFCIGEGERARIGQVL
jgi:hypothetical protein